LINDILKANKTEKPLFNSL